MRLEIFELSLAAGGTLSVICLSHDWNSTPSLNDDGVLFLTSLIDLLQGRHSPFCSFMLCLPCLGSLGIISYCPLLFAFNNQKGFSSLESDLTQGMRFTSFPFIFKAPDYRDYSLFHLANWVFDTYSCLSQLVLLYIRDEHQARDPRATVATGHTGQDNTLNFEL